MLVTERTAAVRWRYGARVGLDRVALETLAMSLEELLRRFETETARAGENDEMAIALLDIERQLQSCSRRFNSTLRKR